MSSHVTEPEVERTCLGCTTSACTHRHTSR